MSSFRRDIAPDPVAVTSPRQKYDGTQGPACIELAREGKWPEEWCAELGFTMDTLYAWANRYPEFEECVIDSWHLVTAHWSRRLREDIHLPGAPRMLSMLARRCPTTWGDTAARNTLEHFLIRNRQTDERPAMAGSGEVDGAVSDMTDEALDQRIAVLTARLGLAKPE